MSVLAETIDRLIKWFLRAQEVRLYCMECTFAKGYLSRNIVRQNVDAVCRKFIYCLREISNLFPVNF